MNYPIMILSFFVLCCFVCLLGLPVMASETTEPTWPQAVTEPTEAVEITEPTEAPYEPITESLYIGDYLEPTEETEPVYKQVIQDSVASLIHADLFGAFLVCGTLVGIFLLRGRYGT